MINGSHSEIIIDNNVNSQKIKQSATKNTAMLDSMVYSCTVDRCK